MTIDNLPKSIKINRSLANIESASGNKLKILGPGTEFEAVVGTMKMRISPFITSDRPAYTIIGYKDLLRNRIFLLKVLNNNNIPHSSMNVTTYRETLEQFDDFFKGEIDNQSVCTFGRHSINTEKNPPIAVNNHRIPAHWEEKIDEQIRGVFKNDIIQPRNSPWCSRVVLIAKKDGQTRLCIDYRPLNRITIKDEFPIPRINDILDALSQAKCFSTLNATSGYHQILLDEQYSEKQRLTGKGPITNIVECHLGSATLLQPFRES